MILEVVVRHIQLRNDIRQVHNNKGEHDGANDENYHVKLLLACGNCAEVAITDRAKRAHRPVERVNVQCGAQVRGQRHIQATSQPIQRDISYVIGA